MGAGLEQLLLLRAGAADEASCVVVQLLQIRLVCVDHMAGVVKRGLNIVAQAVRDRQVAGFVDGSEDPLCSMLMVIGYCLERAPTGRSPQAIVSIAIKEK